jgi:Lon protease-like protein
MVIGECYHLPGTLLPLYIFEQRYRDMLEHALGSSRMFCVGLKKDPKDKSEHPELLPYATAAVINACVKQQDGTSQLVLLGTQRVKFTGWVQQTPFRMAKVEALPSVVDQTGRLQALEARTLDLVSELLDTSCPSTRAVLHQLRSAQDPELTCDVLTYHLVKKGSVLRAALTEADVTQRYALLLRELEGKAVV